jgi:eukaryotic-like serine/threonine-protein kinase
MIGESIAHYRITAKIGAGGMGEVYRATDTKLGRDVAIKVLPAAVARDPERMARFEREAKVLAALNHPNIAAIYGLEDRAIIMELVEGPTLAERIASGPIPLEESLKIAAQIADALEAAHERGIVHRDLKPANVKAPHEGPVKVLDLGLATALPGGDREASSAANSPTLTMGATEAGVILGTAAYMSPEQASGRRVDRRADIWSFGIVLWEMLTGKRMFDSGETVSHILADVLRAPIDLEKLPAATPPAIRELLKRCLDRDVKTRLRDIGEARIAISRVGQAVLPPVAVTVPSRAAGGIGAWITAAVFALALATLAFLHFRETPPPEHTLRYTIAPPESVQLVHSFAISPDGRTLVMAAAVNGKLQLWQRPLDALQWQPMPSTDGGAYPFWSSDSRNIAFFAGGKLRRIAASGGPSQPVCDATNGRGGSWNRDDVIVFSPAPQDTTVQSVPAGGGVPHDVTKTKGIYRFPKFLPDGRHFLYLVSGLNPEKNGTYVSSLDGTENRRLLADNSSVEFAPSSGAGRLGHLVFIRENTLMAQPFDGGTGQVSGEVFPVSEGVAFTNVNNFAPVTASGNGVLLYWTGGGGGGGGINQIVWYDRAGKLLEPVGQPGIVIMPAISPDEKTIAFSRGDSGSSNRDIILRDLGRQNDRRLTTDASQNATPFFSPKGDRIVFRSDRGGHVGDLYLRASNGSGQDEVLLSTPNPKMVNQWSRDGRFIVYMDQDPKTKTDVWYLPMGEGGKTSGKQMPFVHSEFNEFHGQLSPDSKWMAYTSEVSGQREIYVQPFPSADNELRISTAGGAQPRWRGDGKELFYLAPDGKLTAVAVTATAGPKPSLTAGVPVALFDTHISAQTQVFFNYDVTADGKRFLVDATAGAALSAGPSTPPLTVRINWNAASKQ